MSVDPWLARRMREAIRLHGAGELAAAAPIYREVLSRFPDEAEAWYLSSVVACSSGNAVEARSNAERALRIAPMNPVFHYAYANALLAGGEPSAAITAYRHAMAGAPELAEVRVGLGMALLAAGLASEAVKILEQAVRLAPALLEAHFQLGNALQSVGRPLEAAHSFDQALLIGQATGAPDNPLLLVSLATCQRALGRDGEAESMLVRALDRSPGWVPALTQLASLLSARLAWKEVSMLCRQALEIAPGSSEALTLLAEACRNTGDVLGAIQAYDRLALLQPGKRLACALSQLVLPPIPPSIEAVAEGRRRLELSLDRLMVLCTDPAVPRVSDPLHEISLSSFYLSYHGVDNRVLMERIASVLLKACPSLDWTAPHVVRGAGQYGGPAERRLRVGFISHFLHSHSIGRTSRGLIAQVDRSRFEVIALHVPPSKDDALSRLIRAEADHNVDLPASVPLAREAIAALELDILFYQDIGMDPFTYLLAFSRLAPVQCVSFGHPDTTGIPNIDWFISSTLYETPGSQAHFSERLYCLRDAGTLAYYYRPAPPASIDRSRFGLPSREEATLYLCPQTLFKLHPEFDAILAEILARDPRAVLVLIEPPISEWRGALHQRLSKAFPQDALQRVRFVPRQPQQAFLELIASADVMLDTIHFNGMNTSLEAFAVGTPVVTWPQVFQRSRHTAGMYRRMGIETLIADSASSYVRIAVGLGQDPVWRQRMHRLILERCAVLFEDQDVVRQFERFFSDAAAGCCPGLQGGSD